MDKAFIIDHAAAQSTVVGILLPNVEEMPFKLSEVCVEPLSSSFDFAWFSVAHCI